MTVEPLFADVDDAEARAVAAARALGAGDGVACATCDGDPASKARARVMTGYSYTPKKTRAAQAVLADALCTTIEPFTGNVVVACVFFRKTRQRIDIDNLVKLVLDAGTQAELWEDDSQVTAIAGVLELDRDRPRTIVAMGEHQSSMMRGTDWLPRCAGCGEPFNTYGVEGRRFCSQECRTQLAEPVPCAQCGEPFARRLAKQKFCSLECRGKAQRRPRPCAGCGRQRARLGSSYCRVCWRAGTRAAQEAVLAAVADGAPHKMEEIATAARVVVPDVSVNRFEYVVRALHDAGTLARERRGWYVLAGPPPSE